jgi:hypothetical protein
VEMHHRGDPELQAEVVGAIERVFAEDLPGRMVLSGRIRWGERVVQQLGDANGRRRSRSQRRLRDSVATLADATDIIPILYNGPSVNLEGEHGKPNQRASGTPR